MYKASCHCGAIQVEIDEKPDSLTECTCSICHRIGARWAYYTRKQVLISGTSHTRKAYLWGDKCLEFYHCKTCGCTTHYESVEKKADSRIAINTRMMRREDTADIRVKLFDGADSWKFLIE